MQNFEELPMVVQRKDIKKVWKTWGFEEWIWNEEYCLKILKLDLGHASSYHKHQIKDEVLYVLSGQCTIFISWDDDENKSVPRQMKIGDSLHIPVGLRHRIVPTSDLIIIEASTHHKDSDSHRLSPGY